MRYHSCARVHWYRNHEWRFTWLGLPISTTEIEICISSLRVLVKIRHMFTDDYAYHQGATKEANGAVREVTRKNSRRMGGTACVEQEHEYKREKADP